VTISSRTPEGEPNRCPICGNDLALEPSIDTRDAPCPSCGHLLWFKDASVSSGTRLSPTLSWVFLIRMGKERLGPLPLALERPLLKALRMLNVKGRLPDCNELVDLLGRADDWADVYMMLRPPLRSCPSAAYRAGVFVRRQYKRLLASKMLSWITSAS
jgi:hypothetical protein